MTILYISNGTTPFNQNPELQLLTLKDRLGPAARGAGEGLEAFELCLLTADDDIVLALLAPAVPPRVEVLGGLPFVSAPLGRVFAGGLGSSLWEGWEDS